MKANSSWMIRWAIIPEFEETKVWVNGEEVEQQEAFTNRHLLTHSRLAMIYTKNPRWWPIVGLSTSS